MVGNFVYSTIPSLSVLVLTKVWEACRDQFFPLCLGMLIPRSEEDFIDRLLSAITGLGPVNNSQKPLDCLSY